MMNQIKELYITCRQNHVDLVEAFQPLTVTNSLNRNGNEEFIGSLKELGSGVLSVAKWVGNKTYPLFVTGVKAVGVQLTRSFDDNKSLTSKIGNVMKSDQEYEFSFSSSVMGSITSTGNWSDFGSDIDNLIKTMDGYVNHLHQVKDYLSKELVVARKLKGANTTSAIVAVVREFESLKYPSYSLPHKNGEWLLSDVLPGGKVLKFKQSADTIDYSMSGDKPAGESHTLTASKSDVQSVLTKIAKLNDTHLKVKESYADYLDFVKSWSSVVEEASNALGNTTGVGTSVINEAERILKGNPNALAFYSGFTPRVVSYVDKYIQDVLGVLSKII